MRIGSHEYVNEAETYKQRIMIIQNYITDSQLNESLIIILHKELEQIITECDIREIIIMYK